MENQNHKILGIVFFSELAITLLLSLIFLALFGFSMIFSLVSSGSSDGIGIYLLMISVIVLIYGTFIAVFGIAGWKLFKNKPGGKGWGIAASLLSIFFFFPLGFLVMILGFVLLFMNNTNANNQNVQFQQNNNFPPPPQSWQ